MNIHEYQAKQLLRLYGVPVPRGDVAHNPAEAETIAEELDGPVWVVKAQIHAGGRGKAGGVRICRSVKEVVASADRMLGRFAKSRTVGAHFGLTPRRHQSGTSIDFAGHISKQGDFDVREALCEAAASLLLRVKRWSALKAWGMKIAKRASMMCAIVAVARKLASILHRMWVDGTEFRWSAGAAITEKMQLKTA